ncbi:hypothetical protein EWM64_g6558 [Hericium alpestre]|uniref:Uncharacterized protein n=1 Tax=Hericium alpestre TaxID=135208 RepID=A0A4Y9ZT76_9AGAM|nr:hypothetical protein EWM64_g6558 [Hericium alpestre]
MQASSPLTWRMGVYKFPTSLKLSNDGPIEHLLEDMPPISLGLLGFAALTFFLLMRRINFASVFLFSAVLMMFFAAILDISQGLVRGRRGVDNILALNLVTVREVFYSLAVGLRFLFFWAFAALPPRGEMESDIIPLVQDTSIHAILFKSTATHSACWTRWGILGHALKWTMLAMSIAVTVLQVVWRTVQMFNHSGSVFEAESAMEIIMSGILIIKLLLNTLIAETPSRLTTFLHYLPIFFALAINLGVGIGSLAEYAFSESLVGRFLVSVELYIAMLHMLISTFYPIRMSTHDLKRLSSFKALRLTGMDSVFGGPQGDNGASDTAYPNGPAGTAYPNGPAGTAYPNGPVDTVYPQHGSGAVSLHGGCRTGCKNITSMTPGRQGAVENDEEVKLWNKSEAELGNSPSVVERDIGMPWDQSPITPGAKQSPRWQDPFSTSVMASSPVVTNRPPDVSVESFVTPAPYRRYETDSPVYGLSGTMRGGDFSPSVSRNQFLPSFTTDSSSELDIILREQQALEKSIAALRLSPDPYQSRPDSGFSVQPSARDSGVLGPRSALGSESMRSELSLSNFPPPPGIRRASLVPEVPVIPFNPAQDQNDAGRYSVELLPPRMPAAMAESLKQTLPSSARNSENTITGRGIDSGIQFDVTSFIEGQKKRNSSLSAVKPPETDSDSEGLNSAMIVTVERQLSNARRAQAVRVNGGRLPPSQNFDRSRSPITDRSGASSPSIYQTKPASSMGTEQPEGPAGRSAPSSMLSPAITPAQLRRPQPVGRRKIGLPARPKLDISAPRVRSMDTADEEAYEKPRPAPSAM